MPSVNTAPPRPVVFCDIDDVLCLNDPFGCRHVRDALLRPNEAPPDIWKQVFYAGAVEALNVLLSAYQPEVVITSTWQALLDCPHFQTVFRLTSLPTVADNLHRYWDAPTNRGELRLHAIDRWLRDHHRGEPVLIIDDHESGASLMGSSHHREGRAVLCEPGVGFTASMLPAAERALLTPYVHRSQ